MIKSTKDLVGTTGTVLVFLYEGNQLADEVAGYLPEGTEKLLSSEYGNKQELLVQMDSQIRKVVVFGAGEREKMTKKKLRELAGRAARDYKKEEICIHADSLSCDRIPAETAAREAAYAAVYSRYDFQKIGAEKEEEKQIQIYSAREAETDVLQGKQDADCVNHARNLGNMPGNYMTPEKLAEEAQKLAEELGVSCEILTNRELEELHAGALLGVNKGSANEARLITLTYEGKSGAPYTAIVGKGLTFDSGGYNLKPTSAMSGMKYDMCGGADALTIFELIVRRQEKVNVMAVIPATENKIGPDGYTCDDVLVSMSGKTIEITNTDAEGRLILCDAITYAQKKGAKAVIDLATLTGACVVALGKSYTGAFTNSQPFFERLKKAAEQTDEQVWQLPVDEDFHERVRESSVADMTNAVSGGAGSSLAAAFLEEFIEEGVEWIHLDIAGTSDIEAEKPYAAKGATGAMVRTVAELFGEAE